MPLTPPPPYPDINDPATFAARASAFVAWLADIFVDEMNELVYLGGVTYSVQSAPSDATPLRLLLNGAHGLGGDAILLGNASVTDGSLPTGIYRYETVSSSSGGPAGVTLGTLIHARRLITGGETQLLVVEAGTGLATPGSVWTRARTSGAWSVWSRIGPSAGPILLNRTVLTPTAGAVDVTFDRTLYDVIEVVMHGLIVGSQTSINLWLGNDDATVFDSGASDYSYYGLQLAPSLTASGDASASSISLLGKNMSPSGSGGGLSGSFRIIGAGASHPTVVHGDASFTGTMTEPLDGYTVKARRTSTAQHGSFRLFPGEGTFGTPTGGTVTTYGWPKA